MIITTVALIMGGLMLMVVPIFLGLLGDWWLYAYLGVFFVFTLYVSYRIQRKGNG